MLENSIFRDRKVWAWAFYDWANSVFLTSVVTVFFPIFFKKYFAAGSTVTESSFYLGIANSTTGLIVALSAPLLGAMADRGIGKKKFLFGFMILGVFATATLTLASKGEWGFASVCFIVSAIGYYGSTTFYDSLIIGIAPKGKTDLVSAFGFSMGYLSGGIFLIVHALMVTKPELFGFSDTVVAVKWVFISVAIWWLIFSMPLLFGVPEPPTSALPVDESILRSSFNELVITLKKIPQQRNLFFFLIAFFFYMDGVSTIIKMAVSYGKDLGISDASLIKAVILVQFVSFPAALIYGKIGEVIGPKKGILAGIIVYAVITLWGAVMNHAWEFYCIAVLIGLVQGGVQSLSRSAYTRLIPEENATEYFGFFSLFAKFSSVLGPLIMGTVGLLTGNPRISIVAVLILFIVGALFLLKVPSKSISARNI